MKTIGVGQCRVCKRWLSLLKSHICPECREIEQSSCIRCGNTYSVHGERSEESPPGCGWTRAMVLQAASPVGVGVQADSETTP